MVTLGAVQAGVATQQMHDYEACMYKLLVACGEEWQADKQAGDLASCAPAAGNLEAWQATTFEAGGGMPGGARRRRAWWCLDAGAPLM